MSKRIVPAQYPPDRLEKAQVFQLLAAKSAKRTLAKMPPKVAANIREKIHAVAANPHARNNNVQPLTGVPGYRLRIGNWRVLYLLDWEARTMTVTKILTRGGAY